MRTAGNRVRELRERKLMTQVELARRANLAVRTVHAVEKGMSCRPRTKRKILRALGLNLRERELVFPDE